MSRQLLVAVSLVCGCAGGARPVLGPGPQTAPAAPSGFQGLAAFTNEMLRHGAGDRTTEQIAETIEFVGGDLSVETDTDYSAVEIRVLRDQVDVAMELLADLATEPTFPDEEIEKVRLRELDRLAVMAKTPRWLAERTFYRTLYGERHPYGRYDADPGAIARIGAAELRAFHAEHYVPRNAFVVVAGDIGPDEARAAAERHFARWSDRPAPEREIPPPPAVSGRRVVVVDRPGSTQTEVMVGAPALRRADPDWVRLRVANQVLGGNASARLFMNLRERCSYSYGVYSRLESMLEVAPLYAGGAVDASKTAGALRELFAELDRIVGEPPPEQEIEAAEAYLSGIFPIMIETPGNLASLVAMQRVYGLPSDYWRTYRSSIEAVTPREAAEAAGRYFEPDNATVVLVGDAAQVARTARRYGEVTIVTPDLEVVGTLDGAPDAWPGPEGMPLPCPAAPAGSRTGRAQEPPRGGEPRDLDFPQVHEAVLDNGLTVLTVAQRQLPVVYLRLVVRSGSAADPL